MKNRIKEVRKSTALSQTKFGERLGVSLSAVQKWELGITVPSDATILLMSKEFGVNETWLRTGAGSMTMEKTRAAELAELVQSLMADQPESFRSALVTTLLRFDPNAPEWDALEKIYDSVAAEYQKSKDPGK